MPCGRPRFAYNHAAGGASANAGAFYGGTTWPAEYQRALFIADYNRAWIRYLTFDAQGRATVHNFGTASTGPVQMLVGPDTNLYWMMYNSSGGQLRRIRYTGAGNTPPTAIVDATPTVGLTPLTVTFDADASFDPDAQALDYAWNFGDGAVSATKNPTHVYTTAGVYDATLTVTERTAPFASSTATVRITVGNNPPLAEIIAPSDGAAYRVGDTISFAGRATAGGTPLPASQLTWELRHRHNEHVHYSTPAYGADPADPTLSVGSFPIDDHGDNTSLAVCLTATIDAELTDTRCVDLVPETVDITIDSEPSGMLVSYEDEGLELATPAIVAPIVGSTQTVSLETVQQSRTFVGWSDGVTSPSRTFTAGATAATYTALFENSPPVASIAALDPSTGEAPLTVRFSATASDDAEGDLLTYAWDAGAAGTSTSATPTFTFDTTGSHAVVLAVTDQLGATDTTSTTVTVAAGNQPPVAGDDQVDTAEDTAVTIDVLANDTDADDGSISVRSVTAATTGTAAITPAGTVSYVPNTNACGTDTFGYTIADARGAVDSATVNVDVVCTNDAPTVATPDRLTPEGTAITLSAAGADVDDPAAELSYSWTPATVLSDPSSPTPTMTAVDNGATTYTVTVCDPQGVCAIDTAVVTVTNVTPGVTLGGDVIVGTGQLVQFQAALADPGADDLTLTVAWGDGVTELVSGRGPHALAHTYAGPGSYSVQACVTDDEGARSCDTAQATVQGLPAPWSWTGVGAVTAPGSSSYSAGTFTVVNQGPPIDGRTDGLTFVHQQRNGNVEIIARVGSITNTGAKASAGIMIRNSLSAGSPFVAVHVLARGGVLLDTRQHRGCKDHRVQRSKAAATALAPTRANRRRVQRLPVGGRLDVDARCDQDDRSDGQYADRARRKQRQHLTGGDGDVHQRDRDLRSRGPAISVGSGPGVDSNPSRDRQRSMRSIVGGLAEGDGLFEDELGDDVVGVGALVRERSTERCRARHRRGADEADDVVLARRRVDRCDLPTDLVRPRVRRTADPRFVGRVAPDPNRRRGEGHTDQEHEGDDDQRRISTVDGPAFRRRSRGHEPVHPVDRHHDEPGGQNGGDVRAEQQQCAGSLAVCVRLRTQADDGERWHQRDRDRHARQRVGDVAADEGDRPHGTGGERGEEIDEPRVDPSGHLTVRRRNDIERDEQPDGVPDGDGQRRTADHEQDRTDQVGPVAEHDTEHRAEDRDHQGCDDHRPDDRGGRIGDDSGRGDHRCEGQEDPEAAELPARLRPVEEHGIAHPLDVARGHTRLVRHVAGL